ncbi:uncharacterized protein LOC123008911 [Tribolium madens]|uniref:uncharacterized protein LOC123008911 n=1 Tax=Tribolium madens TaxID=41895 RepID=UPI001CF766E8|nr:uncharacterized protein LOC123008911 [Tribolium madens]
MAKVQLLLVLNLFLISLSETNHSVTKRSLLFPRATVLQFTYGISAPAILPSRSINLSLCFQVNYDLPYNISNFRPKIIQAKANDHFDLSRGTFYKYIIKFLNNFGIEGKECLYRLICEMAEYPMHLDHSENLLEKIVHFVFTPSLELSSNSTEKFSSKLLEAENLGKINGNCHKTYSKCFVPLLSLFTAKYII